MDSNTQQLSKTEIKKNIYKSHDRITNRDYELNNIFLRIFICAEEKVLKLYGFESVLHKKK